MRRYVLGLLIWCAALSPARADEALVIDTPLARDAVTAWVVGTLHLERGGMPGRQPAVIVTVIAQRADGQCAQTTAGCLTRTIEYTGAPALMMLNALNSANLSTQSLTRRILDRLRQDGHLGAGSFSGDPGIVTPTPQILATPTITP